MATQHGGGKEEMRSFCLFSYAIFISILFCIWYLARVQTRIISAIT